MEFLRSFQRHLAQQPVVVPQISSAFSGYCHPDVVTNDRKLSLNVVFNYRTLPLLLEFKFMGIHV